jgi:hypothetical protein
MSQSSAEDPIFAKMHQDYLTFAQERGRFPAANSALTSEQVDYVLNRLAYWWSVFSGYSDTAAEHERQQSFHFPLYHTRAQNEILSLQLAFLQLKLGRPHAVPAPVETVAPVKRDWQQEAALHERRIREEVRTRERKTQDLMRLQREWALKGRPFLVVPDPGDAVCGVIHTMCGHLVAGRCNRPMAHSVVANQLTHQCGQCGLTYTL